MFDECQIRSSSLTFAGQTSCSADFRRCRARIIRPTDKHNSPRPIGPFTRAPVYAIVDRVELVD